MIISENKIKIFGKMYRTKIDCVTIRRLTTLEFLFLSCVNKFSKNINYSDIYVKDTFEKIFQIQNSELLLKPCMTSLKNIGVLDVTDVYEVEYSKLKFSQFKLTSIGESMLAKGRNLGEPREIVNDIYYNPLTRTFNNYERLNFNHFIDLNINHIWNVDFPSEEIKKGLEDGSILNRNFIASKYMIQNVELDSEKNWENCYTTFKINLEEDNISLTPLVYNKKAENDLINKITTWDIGEDLTKKLVSIDQVDIEALIGSGNKIKEQIVDICKNSKYLLMQSSYFKHYKENLINLKNKVYFLFGSNKFKIENIETNVVIYIPESFEYKNCVVINNLNEHISLCKKECNLNGEKIFIPLAYTDLNIVTESNILKKSIIDLVNKKFANDWIYLSIIAYAPFRSEFKTFQNLIIKDCKNKGLNMILDNLQKVKESCNTLKVKFFDIEFMSEVLKEKLTKSSILDMLNSIKMITESKIVEKNSDLYKSLLSIVLQKLGTPKLYSDISSVLNIIQIKDMDEAIIFDELLNPLYNKDVIVNMIRIILTNPDFKFSQYFEMDIFFNEYLESIKEISTLTIIHDLYSESNKKSLLESVQNCPDIAKLKSNLEKLHSKHSDLLQFNINIFEEMSKIDKSKTSNFYDNIHFIENTLNEISGGIFRKSIEKEKKDEVVENKHVDKKVYVIDTCSIIKNPRLFQYFSEDEYIRIPTKVIDELGKIKDKRNSKYSVESSSTARIFCKDVKEIYLTYFNRKEKVRFIIENCDDKLLPIDLDKKTPDNLILTVALKYKNWDVTLISDDGQFRLTAHTQNIPSMTSKEFIASHTNYFTDKTNMIVECERIKHRQNKKIEENRNNVDIIDNQNINFEAIDNFSIRKLKDYMGMLTNDTIVFLESNKIKTIKEYRMLTATKFNAMTLKGKNSMRKEEVLRSLKIKDAALKRMLSDYE